MSLLSTFISDKFSSAVAVDPVDTGVGTGSQSTYPLINKSAYQMAATVQSGNSQYFQPNGGFTKDTVANTVTLSSAPLLGTQLVFPGVSQLVADAFDQATIPGNSTPNVIQVPFWIGDVTNINNNKYQNLPQNAGIALSIVNLDTAAGALLSMCQLTCSDQNGNALAFLPTGQTLMTPNIAAFGLILASSAAGASSIIVQSASSFILGDYIIVNIGFSTQEVLRILAIDPINNILTTTPMNYNHYAGEFVFTCCRQFWLQVTIPIGYTNNTPQSWYNLSLQKQGIIVSRP